MADLTQSLIQIKRSKSNAHPGLLRPGEFAFSSDDLGEGLGVLYIGGAELHEDGTHAATVHTIGGTKFTKLLGATEGKVSAGKAVIVGANGEVDQLAVGTLNGTVSNAQTGAKTLVIGDGKTTTIINDPYVAGAGEGGVNVSLADYVASLVTSGVGIVAGDGIADVTKDESGSFVIGLAEVGTAGTYGSETKIPSIEVNEFGQVVAVTEKEISTKLTVDSEQVDLVAGKLATADGVKSAKTAEGVVTVSVDDTVLRTAGGQTVAGTFAVTGQATFGVAPKVGEEETVVTDATVGDALVYKSEIPTTKEVGGIKVGETFPEGITVLNLIDTMLHPYVAPTGSSLTTTAKTGTYEYGNPQTVSTGTLTWKNGSQQINKVEIRQGSKTGTVVATKALSSLVTSAACPFTTNVTVSSSTTFYGKIYDATSSYDCGSSSLTFVYPYYMGVVDAGVELTGDVVKALTKKVQGRTNGSNTFSTGGVAKQIVYAYPASHSDLKSIQDPNKFENIDSFTKSTMSITGLDGSAQNYKVYVANMNVDAFAMTFTHS